MEILEARSVVGLAGVEEKDGGRGEEAPILNKSDAERIFRISAIKNRFSCTSAAPSPRTWPEQHFY